MLFEQRIGFLDRGAMVAGRAPQIAAEAAALADREGHVFEHAQAAEQLGDLKGADETALDARRLRQRGDVGAVEQRSARRSAAKPRSPD